MHRWPRQLARAAVMIALVAIPARPSAPDASSVAVGLPVRLHPLEHGLPAIDGADYRAVFTDRGLLYRARHDTRGLASVPPAPFASTRWRTTSVRRGGHLIYDGGPFLVPSPAVADGVVSYRLAPDLEERYRGHQRGVEQSWHFAALPPGAGELVLEGTFEGLAVHARDSRGLLLDAGAGSRLRYGVATISDAAGRSLRVVPEPGNSYLVTLRVPGAWLERAQAPWVIDPLISVEFGMDTPIITAAFDEQSYARVASDGTDYLVVWGDSRVEGNEDSVLDGVPFDVWGARVSAAGVVLDVAGIPIAAVRGSEQRSPAVAFDGTNYVVAWADARSGQYDIYAARVATDGRVLDPAGIAVTTATGIQHEPDVAGSGGNSLIVWRDERSGTPDIYAARLAATGSVLDGAGIAVSTAANSQRAPAVASAGAGFLVAWQDDRTTASDFDVYAARVDSAGQVLDPAGVVVHAEANSQFEPAIASSGTGYLLAWSHTRNNGNKDVRAGRVTSDGTVLDSGGGVTVIGSSTDEARPAVAWNGTHFAVAWEDGRGTDLGIYVRRLDTSAAIVDSTEIDVSSGTNDRMAPAIAANGSGFYVAWHCCEVWETENVRGTRLAADGSVLDDVPTGRLISTSPSVQWDVDVARSASQYLVVWSDRWDLDQEGHNLDLSIRATRITATGSVLDASGIAVSAPGWSTSGPAVASDGSSFLVAWHTVSAGYYDVHSALLDASGAVVAETPLAIVPGVHENAPAAAYVGPDYLVSYDGWSSGFSYDVYVQRVDRVSGALSGSAVRITSGTGEEGDSALACNSAGCLIAWRADAGGAWELRASRLGADGQPLDTPSKVLGPIASGKGYLAVASDGTDFLVAWDVVAGGNDDLVAVRVRASDGAVLDPSPLALATITMNQRALDVAFVGASYLLTWQDSRNGVAFVIQAARVGTDGVLVDGPVTASGFVVNDSTPDPSWAPALACLGPDCLVAYSHYSGLPYTAERVFARVVDPAGAVGPCVPTGQPDSDCDRVDDDCNGAPDDAYLATPTTCGVGVCTGNSGLLTCQGGVEVDTCDPLAGAAASDATCDSVDDDCSGTSDEDYLPTATTCGVGACAGNSGLLTCQGGAEVDSCDPLAGAAADDATCDNIDEDCSGTADDDYRPTVTTCGVGACERTGTSACQGGSVIDSCTPGPPLASNDPSCDGVDDDCDAFSDEDAVCPAASVCEVAACSSQAGQCEASRISDCCLDEGDCASAAACIVGACDATTHRCRYQYPTGCCHGAADCDDQNGCTTDRCDAASGACVPAPVAYCCNSDADCDDGDPCSFDECVTAQRCLHRPSACATSSPCGADTACLYSGLHLARGAATPDAALVQGTQPVVVLQLELTSEALGGALETLRLRLQGFERVVLGPAPMVVTLHADADGDGAIDPGRAALGAAQLVDLVAGEVRFAGLSHPIAPAARQYLLVAIGIERASRSAGCSAWSAGSAGGFASALLGLAATAYTVGARSGRRRRRQLFVALLLSAVLGLACARSGFFTVHQGVVAVAADADVGVRAGGLNEALWVQGAPVQGEPFELLLP